MNMTDSNDSKF